MNYCSIIIQCMHSINPSCIVSIVTFNISFTILPHFNSPNNSINIQLPSHRSSFSNKHKLRLFTIHMSIRIRKHNLQVILHLLQHRDHLFQRIFLIL